MARLARVAIQHLLYFRILPIGALERHLTYRYGQK